VNVEFSLFFVALAVWFLVSAVSRMGRGSRPTSGTPRQMHQRSVQLRLGSDLAGQPGSGLEIMLRELQRALETGASRPSTRQPAVSGTLEGGSLEVEPEARSLEDEVTRADRRAIDLDDEAEQIVARRLKAAAAREQAHPAETNQVVSSEIRPEPADHTATHGYTRRQLRDAVVWREILGPPVSER
jgi:hypothetical protein